MPFYSSPYIILPLLSALVNAVLAQFCWRRRSVPAALPAFWLTFAMSGWSLAYAANTASTELFIKILCYKTGVTFVCLIVPSLLALSLESVGLGAWVTRRRLLLVSAIPIVSVFLAWTSELHHLQRYDFYLYQSGPLLLLGFKQGAFFLLHSVYAQLIDVVSIGVFISCFRRKPREEWPRFVLMILATVIPLTVSVLQITPVKGFDLTISTLLFSGLCYAVAIFRLRLLDLVPVARETLHQKQEELSLSEERFRTLAENSADAIWQIDWEYRILYISNADQAMRGYTQEEVIGRPIFDIMNDASVAEIRKMNARRLEEEQQGIRTGSRQCEIQLKCKNNTMLWAEINSNPLRNGDGTIIGYIGAIRDISERKKIEEELLAEKHKLMKTLSISDSYHAQLVELNSRIKGLVEEEERSRLYRDLHDGAGQSLHAVCLHLKMLAAGKGGYDDPKPLAAQLAQEVADVAAELRDIAHQLRPTYLQEIALDKAIARRCDMLVRRGVPIEYTSSGDFSSLPHRVSDNFYRIAQEAVANAARHAEAGRIVIALTRAGDTLQLSVADDGSGIDEAIQSTDGMGLRIMKERAAVIGALLDIFSSPSGTTISVIWENL